MADNIPTSAELTEPADVGLYDTGYPEPNNVRQSEATGLFGGLTQP